MFLHQTVIPFDSHETYGSIMELDGKISLLSHMISTSSNSNSNSVSKSKETVDDLLTRLTTIPFCKKFISVVAKDLDLTNKDFLNSVSIEDVENDNEMKKKENEEEMELNEN